MSPLVTFLLFGWPLMTLPLFVLLPARRAVIASLIAGWLFLPVFRFGDPGLQHYGKIAATVLAPLLGAIIFDPFQLLAFRPRLWDLPALIWCLCPIATSISNDLGFYDGLSNALDNTLLWGVPYFLGRLYFSDLAALRELALGIVIGGLIYVPLCLIEIRMSPQLHRWVYGYYQHSFLQTIKAGGYRPMVFMQHGLAVAVWMLSGAMAALYLWRSKAVPRLWSIPMGIWAGVLAVTVVLCRSGNGYALLAVGLILYATSRWLRQAWPVLIVALIPPLYTGLRYSGAVPRQAITSTAAIFYGENSVQSLEARLIQEDLFSAHASDRLLLGWGGWSRAFPTDDYGNRLTRGVQQPLGHCLVVLRPGWADLGDPDATGAASAVPLASAGAAMAGQGLGWVEHHGTAAAARVSGQPVQLHAESDSDCWRRGCQRVAVGSCVPVATSAPNCRAATEAGCDGGSCRRPAPLRFAAGQRSRSCRCRS